MWKSVLPILFGAGFTAAVSAALGSLLLARLRLKLQRAELVLIEGAGHNETYALGGRDYRDRLWRFIK